jgi:hypothetical protein
MARTNSVLPQSVFQKAIGVMSIAPRFTTFWSPRHANCRCSFPNGTAMPFVSSAQRAHRRCCTSATQRGEYVVYLTVTGRRWEQYTYEFAHELCHIYGNHHQRPNSALAPHQWFEESLCETASLFVLRRMGLTWHARGFEQRNYAPIFAEYAKLLMNEVHRQGPLTLGPWYAHNATRLLQNPYGRNDNEYCAHHLLPLFEAQPEGWKSLPYLNAPTTADKLSFGAYLQHWHDAVPAEQRRFLEKILGLFGLVPELQISPVVLSGN